MSKARLIVFLGVLALVACQTTSQAPLDDAYFWPDKKANAAVVTPAPEVNTQQSTSAPVSTPTMEVISQKDTTITVRIKK